MAVFDEEEDWALSVAVQETKHLMSNRIAPIPHSSPNPVLTDWQKEPLQGSHDILGLQSVQDALYGCLESAPKTIANQNADHQASQSQLIVPNTVVDSVDVPSPIPTVSLPLQNTSPIPPPQLHCHSLSPIPNPEPKIP